MLRSDYGAEDENEASGVGKDGMSDRQRDAAACAIPPDENQPGEEEMVGEQSIDVEGRAGGHQGSDEVSDEGGDDKGYEVRAFELTEGGNIHGWLPWCSVGLGSKQRLRLGEVLPKVQASDALCKWN